MFTPEFIARFESKFAKGAGCWIWEASCAGKGYGQVKLPFQRRNDYAHRIAYQIYRGEITNGRYVCHHCDNPKCVNPEHLYLGTQKENLQDMARKDRSLYGERNARAKLKEADVRKIRACLEMGMTQQQIAAAFGISQIQISRIHTGQRWSKIT